MRSRHRFVSMMDIHNVNARGLWLALEETPEHRFVSMMDIHNVNARGLWLALEETPEWRTSLKYYTSCCLV